MFQNKVPAPAPAHSPKTITAELRAQATDLAARLTAILTPFLLHINARFHLLGAHFLPLHTRIGRAHRRLTRLFARLAAGKPPRQHAPRPNAPRPNAKGGPPAIHFPSRPAWLVATLGHYAAGYASQLQYLLHEPATLAALAAAPPEALKSAARTLRPLCRLLGVDLPAILRLPPKPPRATPVRPPKPPRAPLPPLLPLYPQARPRDWPFMRFAAKTGPPKIRPA